jgi:hypothetical protein
VIRIYVENIKPFFKEMVIRNTVARNSLRWHTPWRTYEFRVYDLNNNVIFYVEDVIG